MQDAVMQGFFSGWKRSPASESPAGLLERQTRQPQPRTGETDVCKGGTQEYVL